MAIVSLFADTPSLQDYSAPLALYIRIYLLPLRLLCDYFFGASHPLEVLLFLIDNPTLIPYCSYPDFLSAVGPSAIPTHIPLPILQFHTFVSVLQFPAQPSSPSSDRLTNIVEYLSSSSSSLVLTPPATSHNLTFSLFQSTLDRPHPHLPPSPSLSVTMATPHGNSDAVAQASPSPLSNHTFTSANAQQAQDNQSRATGTFPHCS